MREDVCPFWEAGSGPAGYGLPRCGALEFLSLAEDLDPQLRQARSTIFVASRARVAVNSLSCFIWVGFEPRAAAMRAPAAPATAGGSPAAARRTAAPAAEGDGDKEEAREPPVVTPPRLTRSAGPRDPGPGGGTGFPYHAPGLPALQPRTLAFSSSQADTPELVANNWPNLVLWLPAPLQLEQGQALEVQSLADLSVDPHIYSACRQGLREATRAKACFILPLPPNLPFYHRRLALSHERAAASRGRAQARAGRGRPAYRVDGVERAPHARQPGRRVCARRRSTVRGVVDNQNVFSVLPPNKK
jgi:hypothetical protein